MAVLSGQLSYPATPAQVRRRLIEILRDEDQAVYVAERKDGRVIGWIHVGVRALMTADRQAEIEGLVVDQNHRRRGIGRLLMDRAERWAGEKGCRSVCLRSNVIRAQAHSFYEGLGYGKIKTQSIFRKEL